MPEIISFIVSEGKEGWDHPPTEEEVRNERKLQDDSNRVLEGQIKAKENQHAADRERKEKDMRELISSLRF